jgi:hypothetical protein
MGKKAKTSRKGKKAWRANISTEEIEDFFEKSTKDALSGGSLSSAPTDSLFVVDKSRGILLSCPSTFLFFPPPPHLTLQLLRMLGFFPLVLKLLGFYVSGL